MSKEFSNSDDSLEELDLSEDEYNNNLYNFLVNINLDWPSQTVVYKENKIYVGLNPDVEHSNEACIQEITFEDNSIGKIINVKSTVVSEPINRIRLNDEYIYAVSDNKLMIFNFDLKLIKEISNQYSYGLFVNNEYQYVGTKNGLIDVYKGLELIKTLTIHEDKIESIVVNEYLYTASCDKTVKISTLEGENLKTFTNDCDVNTISVWDNKIVFGDDKGVITIVNGDNKEQIKGSECPIESIKFIDDGVFVSGNEKEVCFWDLNLLNDSRMTKYLLFVHSSESFYKDIALIEENKIAISSNNGIIICSSISLSKID
ncbi:hypothetical protein A0H76_2443 [Hepatospora eriocheir]|uniref:Uncharacterized protein n=1 Tax=Hepatospora eriocheir TaxID=1081669 RepID=A0A1X0QJU4_9MICR|nr:hypothetical protein A0H76_2443 [Hepatospora eriocheir]